MTMGSFFKTVATLFFVLVSLTGCAQFLDGPFNKNGVLVPELLYDNNNSGYVTYWDEATKAYRTYDQVNSVHLKTAVFTFEEARVQTIDRDRQSGSPVRVIAGARGASRNYMVAGSAIMPLTHLNPQEMTIQKEQGCVACHQT